MPTIKIREMSEDEKRAQKVAAANRNREKAQGNEARSINPIANIMSSISRKMNKK